MEECGLYLGRHKAGVLRWESRRDLLWLEAECPYAPEWIYRLMVETKSRVYPLGVMLPEGERFVLRREIPAGEVPLRAAVDRSRPGESHLPGLPLASSAFEDATIDVKALGFPENTALQSADLLDMQYFRFPLKFGKACPMASYFCLTTVLSVEGECYGFFCRKGDGDYQPISPLQPEKDSLRNENALC